MSTRVAAAIIGVVFGVVLARPRAARAADR